jgi:hypothetical protein
LPLWNPVLAAEQIGTLVAMSDAPFIVQTGIGHGAQQFEAMGASQRTQGKAIDAAIDVIKQLFAGETVEAPEFGIGAATTRPRPPHPSNGGSAPAQLRSRSSGSPVRETRGTSRPGWTAMLWQPPQIRTGRLAVVMAPRPVSRSAGMC